MALHEEFLDDVAELLQGRLPFYEPSHRQGRDPAENDPLGIWLIWAHLGPAAAWRAPQPSRTRLVRFTWYGPG
ncbi:hypothetical protein Pme01_57290 [Planosporangium mesophilum]|uniref:Uncharacterized protein n=1 Tax=Planosporangium mesophilum TaxID=689768 RepID=A0A8J3TI15_9ACTN|nr:hypothetical protein Pme01_57290 [Planosporangium mesophilum]